jgi:Ca2+/Na+ antiporter
MFSTLKNAQLLMASSAVAIFATANTALAQANAGEVANLVQDQFGSFADLIGVVAFVAGIVIVLMGLIKFRQHSQNPQDPSAKMSSAFTMVFIGAAMVALPTVAGVGIASIFGGNAEVTNANDGFRALR